MTGKAVRLLIIMLFMTAFSKGLVNVFSNPPWQAADEPMHLEAAMVTGNSFPAGFPPDEQSDTKYQQQILQVMKNHRFFNRVGLPEPALIPGLFRDTLFIRDAPSKIGRQPLYYLLTGLVIRFFSSGILEALYLCRMINLVILLISMFILLLAFRRLYPDSPGTWLTGLLFLVNLPAFWHIGSSMTPESWKFLLISTGLLLLAFRIEKGISWCGIGLSFIWFAATAATSWTLLPLALIIFAGILFPDTTGSFPKILRTMFFLTIGLGIAGLIILRLTDQILLRHEFNHIITGLKGITGDRVSLYQMANRLFRTFWLGFGWLTIPVHLKHLLLFSLCSIIWLIGILRYGLGLRSDSENRRIIVIVFASLCAGIAMIFIRASSSESAIQGRYLYPLVPAMLMGGARGLNMLKTGWVRRSLILAVILSGTTGDIMSNCGGWLVYQHHGYSVIRDPARVLSTMSWVESAGCRFVLDARHPDSDSFFIRGWYPPEPDNTHRWMMNEAEILLPSVCPQPSLVLLEMYPYVPRGLMTPELCISINGITVFNRHLSAGWQTYTMSVDRAVWLPGLNRMKLVTANAFSPSDTEGSTDRRYLSVAVRRIDIVPSIYTGGIDELVSGWFFTPDSVIQMRTNSGDRQRLQETEPGDMIRVRLADGTSALVAPLPDEEVIIKSTHDLVAMDLYEPRQNKAVKLFRSAEQSFKMLPGLLDDIYLHLLVISFWVGCAIFCSILSVIVFLLLLDA